MRRPLCLLTAKRLPDQSGKYTASPSTVGGVAETSPPVVNTHFGLRPLTFAGLMECSAGWLHVLFRFCPAIRHWPDRDSDERLCALRATRSKRVLINATVASDTLRFFIGICVVLLGFGCDCADFIPFDCTRLTADVLPKWLRLRNSRMCLIQEQLGGWLSTRRIRALR